jgi:ATP-binding cassette subfamily F protein uup
MTNTAKEKEVAEAPVETIKPTTAQARKPTFKEKFEYETLSKEIADLEKEKESITAKLNDSNIPFDELDKLSKRIAEVTNLIDEKEIRWLELSEVVN